ncbi:hypothetical protein AAFF_G00234420, partial [Aldrovandia affinis]
QWQAGLINLSQSLPSPGELGGHFIDKHIHTHTRVHKTATSLSPNETGAGGLISLATMKFSFSVFFCLLLISHGFTAVITGACEKDSQCGGAMCCAISLWIRSLRMCTPMGQEGDECHPMSHKVPFFGKRLHHTCPCVPNLACLRTTKGSPKCLPPYKYQDYYF